MEKTKQKKKPNSAKKKRPLIAKRYEVVNQLTGGMGIVYLCQDKKTKQLVALKTFKPEYLPHLAARDLFLREGTMWVEIGKHPNIVQAYRVERIGNGTEIYLVLEWIVQPKGKRTPSLRSWLRNNQKLPPEQALLFCAYVARGMKFAVEKIPGLVHRDLKPENILIGFDGIARVTDFGLASTLSGLAGENIGSLTNDKENFGRTQLTQGIAGTPLYMAPEQWEKAQVDQRADIYALGCILYEMITGNFAAKADSKDEIRRIHTTGNIKPPSSATPKPVLNVMRKCLAPNRERRFRNWREAEHAFSVAYQALTSEPVPPEIIDKEESQQDAIVAGHSYNTMGLSYLDIGKLDVAVMYFEQAVRIGRLNNSEELEGSGLGNLGLAYMSLGYFERAIEFHEEHLIIAREIGDLAEEGKALGRLGDVYLRQNNPERAVGLHERELSIFQELGDRFQEAASLHRLGDTYRQMQNIEQAESFYKRALSIAREINDRGRVERILNSMGLVYLEAGQIKGAVKLFQQAMEISKEIGDPIGESEIALNLGNLFYKQNYHQKAIQLYNRSLKIAQDNHDLRRQIRNWNQLGDIYMDLGDPEEAQICYEESLNSIRSTGDMPQQLNVLMKLGNALGVRGDYMSAARVLKRARALAREQNKPDIERDVLEALGFAYEAWGDLGRMSDYLQESLQISEQLEEVDEQAHTLSKIGLVNHRTKQWQASINAYQALLRLQREQGNKTGEAVALMNLGDVTRDGGDLKLALDFYKQGLDIGKQNQIIELQARGYSNIGFIYHIMGKKWRANSNMDKAFTAAKKTKNKNLVANVSYRMAYISCRQGKWDKAEPHAVRAQKLFVDLKQADMTEKTAVMLQEIEKNKGKSSGFFG